MKKSVTSTEKSYNEALRNLLLINLHDWNDQSKENEMARDVACVRAKQNAHTYMVHKHEDANFENLKYDGTVWNGFIWVKIKTTGRLLSTWC
jgi:hypothetical protein